MITIRHNRVDLALHELRAGAGRPLLHLHGLGERSPADVPGYVDGWAGPVFALDFTGHGASTVPRGGGYTAEMLLADTDAALRHVGEATLFGRGLGAYVALLTAGARPDLVRGAVLYDGPGMLGGGAEPPSSYLSLVTVDGSGSAPDGYALAELSQDIRPPDYAADFVRLAVTGSPLDHPIAVSAVNRPPWLAGIVALPGVVEMPIAAALDMFSC